MEFSAPIIIYSQKFIASVGDLQLSEQPTFLTQLLQLHSE